MSSSLRRRKKGIVLLSGGIDSATTLYIAKKQGYALHALIFDYQQIHRKEITAAKKIARYAGIAYQCVHVTIPWSKSSLTDARVPLPLDQTAQLRGIPSTYVSGRNIIFLSYAVSFAESLGATHVFIGAHVQDYSGYPDCRPEFLEAFQRAVRLGLKTSTIKIKAPLLHKNKKEIIRAGLRLKVPYRFTWSCYAGGRRPCGRCDSCYFRMRAFSELGIKDPLFCSRSG